MTVTFYYCICNGLYWVCNPLNAELNPICHLLALLGDHHIFHVSRIRVAYCCYFLRIAVDRRNMQEKELYNFVYFSCSKVWFHIKKILFNW